MNPPKQNPSPREERGEELEFNVMPREYRQAAGGARQPEARTPPISFEPDSAPGLRSHYLRLGLIVLVLLAVLGGGGFLVYGKFFKNKPKPEPSATNAIQVPEAPPENPDSDQDGLTDVDEIKHATNPKLADTDGDGLADGDEVNIYHSDPLLSDTDGDGFDDGREVARGYSPIVKSTQKASSEEIKSWADRIAQFKLHEPTPTTLKLKSTSAEAQSKVTYTNSIYKYSLDIPATLTFRESDEGRLVGIYISGTNPEGEILTDPINLSVAVKVVNQTLNDWVKEQYQPSDYEFLQERDIGGLMAIRLVGIKDEACPQNKTFFVKDNTIIIVTWACSQNSAFSDLYEQVVQSFKFL